MNNEIEMVAIDHLVFDPKNPRLPSYIDGKDQKEVIDFMLRDATVIELMQSIGEQSYFSGEPLLVVPVNDKDGYYEVIEGNRRLCAAKLLRHPELAPVRQKSVQTVVDEATHKPEFLPVVKYDSATEILDYLGYRHITGVKPWDPLAKARYLKLLRDAEIEKGESEAQQYKTLAKTIGSRADYVATLLTSLALYEEISEKSFFGIKSLSEEEIDFSLLTTSLSYSNIVEFLGLDSRNDPSLSGLKDEGLKELTKWIFEKNPVNNQTRLGESRNLKRLNNVVSEVRSLTAFREGKSLQEAEFLTKIPAESFSLAIQEARKQLVIARDLLSVVDEPVKADAERLSEISRMARDIKAALDSRLMDKDD